MSEAKRMRQWVREWNGDPEDLLPRLMEIMADCEVAESLFVDKRKAFTTGVSAGMSIQTLASLAHPSVRGEETIHSEALRAILDSWKDSARSMINNQ